MPINNPSPPTTAEDMMASSALAVSPILTADIFNEIYGSSQDTVQNSEIEELVISENPIFSGSREYPRLHTMRTNFVPPPPSDRWTRRLANINHSVESRRQERVLEYHHSTADEEDGAYHIGPVVRPEMVFSPPSEMPRFAYGQNCFYGRAVETSPLLANSDTETMKMLHFDVIYDDGGQYGALYGIENLLLNDGSVYCSGRKGTVNILTQYIGYMESGIITDISCSINKMIIKAPEQGFTAPCKEGLIFISDNEINIENTKIFDSFHRKDYDDYISNKLKQNSILSDKDPVGWFSLAEDRTCIIDLQNRTGKYVLIKMLRSNHESDNIDLQYIGFIGFSGPRAFGSGSFC